ncbi:MAG: periplasmic protein TonB [Acidobacteriota bacterium]|jgi:TonB family protein|nr:periplasmic protein TonB [Acidobacteriota bacterium]
MFGNLVESSSHKGDYARRSWFFLATLTVYALVFLAIGVGSIYAYNTHIETQNLELVSLIAPVETTQLPTPPRNAPARPAPNNNNQRPGAMRTEIIAPTTDPTKVPKGVSTTPQSVPEVTPGLPVVIGNRNVDFGTGGTVGQGTGNVFGGSNNSDVTNTRGVGELVKETPPPMIKKEVSRPPVTRSMGVVNGMANYLPKPVYSAIARAARASGTVTVQVLIDENGKVVSARALNGHPLLLKESVQAAYQAHFTPTLLSNQPVKVSGVITYNFVM